MLLTELKERVGYIILNRLDKKNALNFEFIDLIKSELRSMAADERVKVLVIKSASDVFCAGADLEYLISLGDNNFEQNLKDTSHIRELFEMIYTFPKLTIAQVEGHAIAGGCGIANATDFCYAVDEAKFGYSEVKIGFSPALVSVYLIKKIGEAKARELLLTGKLVSGKDAEKFGLVNEIISKDEIETFVFNFAKHLANTTSEKSIQYTKELIIQLQDKSLQEGLDIATIVNAKMRDTDDFKRGISSFVNKEKLTW
jgi:methylglutaconyl-CoA hydratase